jgi:aspartate carbamoyltransferase
MGLPFTHLTSTAQLTRSDTDAILSVAKDMEVVIKNGGSELLKGKILAALFYEPSTRTRLSFEAAMQRLGGDVISAEGIQFSSMYKGESLEDTITTVNQYADIIAMRHPEAGTAERAGAVSRIPFINAGDGPHDHPTQGLLDVYTILKERGTLEGLNIAIAGDLLNGRTLHSMSQIMSLYKGVRFTLISPEELRMPKDLLALFTERAVPFTEEATLEAGLDADVLYMTRIQKERFTDIAEYERLKNTYILTARHLQGKKVTVMHPLPRVNEITTDIDALPNSAYFRQAHNGLLIRMALLAMLLHKA